MQNQRARESYKSCQASEVTNKEIHHILKHTVHVVCPNYGKPG